MLPRSTTNNPNKGLPQPEASDRYDMADLITLQICPAAKHASCAHHAPAASTPEWRARTYEYGVTIAEHIRNAIGHICPGYMYTAVSARRGNITTCTHAAPTPCACISKIPRHGHVVPHHTHRHAEEGTAAVLPCLAQAVHHNARSLISQCHPRPSRRQLRRLSVFPSVVRNRSCASDGAV